MDRLIICVSCGAEIQHNTPLDRGGTMLTVPGVCDGCQKPAQGATAGHELRVLSLGMQPACICECERFGYAFSHRPGDTQEGKLKMMEEAHRAHLEAL